MPPPRTAKPPELRTLIGAVAWGFAILAVAWIAIVVITRGDDHETAQQFFDRHRTDLDRVAELVADHTLVIPDGLDSYYGPQLPDELRYLSVTGRVSIYSDGSFFLPRWTGIPDDAGGYWNATESPTGRDMYGMGCTNPIDLGSDWWACGM